MPRHPHFLKSNKSVELPHQAVWLDTETDPHPIGPSRIAHRLSFGWGAYQRRLKAGKWSEPAWRRFSTPSELWTWVEGLTRPRTKLYLFAHNWAFDGPVVDMFRELPSRGWQLQTAVIDSPPVILTWRRSNVTLECLDTLNWWRVPLARIGDSVGLPKLSFPAPDATVAEQDTYCRRDVDIIRVAMLRWWELLASRDLGGFASTLAGQAMRAYRHRFMPTQILIDGDDHALQLARGAYHGGRVECYRMGRQKGPIFLYDVNSMYPHVMSEREYPTTLRTRCRKPTHTELRKWSQTHCLVCRAQVETDSPQYATMHGGRLVFPTGRFEASLTTPDLIAAQKQGHLRQVDEVAVYDKAQLFGSYVTELYELRRQANELLDSVQSWLVKILLNSLYGKFGQRGQTWNVIGPAPDDRVRQWIEVDVVEGIAYHMRQFAGILQQREDRPESANSHPAIAAHVTAYARRYLWELMETAGRRNVLYCDTDSLYVTKRGSQRLETLTHHDRLGALKCEGISDYLDIRGAKDYATPEKQRVKGVRAKAKWLDSATVEQEQWSSLIGQLNSGNMSEPTTTTVTKHLSREYTKGRVMPSGSVLPLRLSTW